MAVTNNFRFGSRSNNTTSNQDRPKAEFWLNVGYMSDSKDEDGTYRFVSLSQGIPLDTIEDLPTNSSNQLFAAFQGARNDLRDQLLDVAKELDAGQATIVAEDANTGLSIQIRRVREETAAPTGNANPYAKKLALGG